MRGLKLAIDLGAGGTRRQWDGYVTYTLDARPETCPDYCQDLLMLNLPDEHFDLVASSHAFEHVGRWDQEQLWTEVFRVCKPGGKLEVIVPNVAWAAEKIHQGQEDGHTLNVLYGAQEAHGYAREFNLHYFGYTPAILRALAEGAGFVDVTTESWKENHELGYHLVCRATRPAVVAAEHNGEVNHVSDPTESGGQRGQRFADRNAANPAGTGHGR